MTNQHNQTSSCCAPDGTCSNSTNNQAKSDFHFLTKLTKEQLEKIEITLNKIDNEQDSTQNSSFIKESLKSDLPIYFLKKLIKTCEKQSTELLLSTIKETIVATNS